MSSPTINDLIESIPLLSALPLDSPWFGVLLLVIAYLPTLIVMVKTPGNLLPIFKKNSFALFCGISILGITISIKLYFELMFEDVGKALFIDKQE